MTTFANAKYINAAETMISVDINGVTKTVPKNQGNRDYAEMLVQSITPVSYVAVEMNMTEFRVYRTRELDRIDKEEIPVDLWEVMSSGDKTAWTTHKQALRDLPATVSLTGVNRGDEAAAVAKFPAQPA